MKDIFFRISVGIYLSKSAMKNMQNKKLEACVC